MEPVFTRILLATDGSADARVAARVAADLAERSGAELHVVHAWSITLVMTYPYAVLPTDYPDIFEDDARTVLADETRRIVAAGGQITKQYLRQGRPAEAIIDVSTSIGADLIVTGSRGHHALGRLVLGSVAEGIVRSASCPVLVVRGKLTSWPPTRLIVGNDGSPEADHATESAVAMASLVGASVLLVRALPKLPGSAEIDRNVHNEMMSRLNEVLARKAEALRSQFNVRLETLATSGNPATVLMDIADADPETVLLAVGSRGLGRIARLRLGSVSNDVLHAAHGPVLIVPPQED